MGRRRESSVTWVPGRALDDTTLALEALRPELLKRSRRKSDVIWRVLGSFGGTNGIDGTMGNKMFGGPVYPYRGGGAASVGGDFSRGLAGDRLGTMHLAVDELVRVLNAPERRALRAEGHLPDWFLDEVQTRAEQIKREMRKR